MPTTTEKPKKKNRGLIILGVAITGLGAYGVYRYLRSQNTAKSKQALNDAISKARDSSNSDSSSVVRDSSGVSTTTNSNTSRNDNFPLKKGSKGARVLALQRALMASYGRDILPVYHDDGDFGSETENALKKINKPIVLSEEEYNKIVVPTTTSPYKIGQQLNTAAVSKDLNAVLKLLQQLKTANDYSAANPGFKEKEINGTTQTIVSGLFDVFRDEVDRQKLRIEFTRMGLERVYDEDKKDYIWRIPTLNGLPIITRVPTKVWVSSSNWVNVPARMVLGREAGKKGLFTIFENGGKNFMVLTTDILYA